MFQVGNMYLLRSPAQGGFFELDLVEGQPAAGLLPHVV